VSKRGIIRSIGRLIFVLFLLYSDRILSFYTSLPLLVTWSGATVAIAALFVLTYCARRWTAKIEPYRDIIREGLGQIQFALFSFAFVGIGNVFYKLDVFMILFYMNPGAWILFGVQAFILSCVAGIQYPQLNLVGRAGVHGLESVWRLISRLRRKK
jgi:hypothetical protein